MTNAHQKPDRIMREAEERERSGLSRMTRYRMRQRGEIASTPFSTLCTSSRQPRGRSIRPSHLAISRNRTQALLGLLVFRFSKPASAKLKTADSPNISTVTW